jgi:hypothetical protein
MKCHRRFIHSTRHPDIGIAYDGQILPPPRDAIGSMSMNDEEAAKSIELDHVRSDDQPPR